jgi:hypothetical protein
MKKQYVPKTLTEFLTESKSITLKRKYGQRPTITVGTNAPLRNQVLSFVAENAQVSKRDLKQFIVGLKEGGVTVASANMFIKRNAKYFIAESKNGITYFKLSNLGQRLVNQFVPAENGNVSESVKNARKSLNMILENQRAMYEEDELEGEPELEDDMEDDMEDEIEADDIDAEDGPAEEVDFDEDRFSEDETEEIEDETDKFEYEEDDDKIVLTYYKNPEAHKAEEEAEGEDDFDHNDVMDEDDEDYDEEDVMDDEDMDEDEDRPAIDPRDLDFDEDAVLDDMDEAEKTPQFPTNKLTGKKSGKFGGRYSKKEYHNLLDDNQDKDNGDIDSIESELTEHDSRVQRMKEIIENLKSKRGERVYEAEEATEDDELKDDDLDIDMEDETPETEEDIDVTPEDDGVEKVEITEFIITVDDPDAALDELQELGITAERVPVEEKPAEVAPETEEEPSSDDIPAETPEEGADLEAPEDTDAEAAKESLKAFINANYLNEDEENADPGVSDDLGLGDQGAEATELDAPEGDEETMDATEEFEPNKIKVKAEDWDILKGWLEEKGVDVKEMFGGDIETEEVGEEGVEPEDAEETGVSDDEIDFEGIGDDDETKVEDKE